MPRSIQISATDETIDQILSRLEKIEGIAGVARHRQASIDPPGDILQLQATNDATRQIFEFFSDANEVQRASVVTSEVKSIVSPSQRDPLDAESNETTLDEAAFQLRHETNVSQNYVILMGLAGAIAAVGLWTNTLHIVIGSMIIAPAFEPFVRIPFGIIAGPWRITSRGAYAIVVGYAVMAAGGLLSTLVLRWIQPEASLELQSREWIRFWSTTNGTAVFVSTLAGVGGVIVVCGLRSVLTTGVMIALALIPSMTLVGMALAVGDLPLAGDALIRWSVDAGLVMLAAAIVLKLKQRYRFGGRSMS